MIEKIKEFGKSLVPGYHIDKIVNETAENYMANYEGLNVMECANDIINEMGPKIKSGTMKRQLIGEGLIILAVVTESYFEQAGVPYGAYFMTMLAPLTHMAIEGYVFRSFAKSNYKDNIKEYAQEYIMARRELEEVK